MSDAEDKIMKALRDCGRQMQKNSRPIKHQTFLQQREVPPPTTSLPTQLPKKRSKPSSPPMLPPTPVTPSSQTRIVTVTNVMMEYDDEMLDILAGLCRTDDESSVGSDENDDCSSFGVPLDPLPVIHDDEEEFVLGDNICQTAATDETFRNTLAWIATLE